MAARKLSPAPTVLTALIGNGQARQLLRGREDRALAAQRQRHGLHLPAATKLLQAATHEAGSARGWPVNSRISPRLGFKRSTP